MASGPALGASMSAPPAATPGLSAATPPSAPAGVGALPPGTTQAQYIAELQNFLFAGYIVVALGFFGVFLLVHRLANTMHRYLRTISCVQSEKQSYFKRPAFLYAKVKQNIIYAPLFRVRHSRELILLKRWSVGGLPMRFQSFFIVGMIVMNITVCLVGLPYAAGTSSETFLTSLQHRTGTVTVSNLLPLAAFADRSNPLIGLLDISYDTFSLLHRWLGRIIVGEVITHLTAYMVREVLYDGGFQTLTKSLQAASYSPQTGLIVSMFTPP